MHQNREGGSGAPSIILSFFFFRVADSSENEQLIKMEATGLPN